MEIRFINGDEGQRYMMSLARYNLTKHVHMTKTKIYPGQYWAIYRFDELGINPIVLAKLKVLSIGVNDHGLCANIFDIGAGTQYEVTHVPAPFCGYDIGIMFPQRAYIEHTLKEMKGERSSRVYEGVAAGVSLLHISDPEKNPDDHECAIRWTDLPGLFNNESAFHRELEAYKRRTRA